MRGGSTTSHWCAAPQIFDCKFNSLQPIIPRHNARAGVVPEVIECLMPVRGWAEMRSSTNKPFIRAITFLVMAVCAAPKIGNAAVGANLGHHGSSSADSAVVLFDDLLFQRNLVCPGDVRRGPNLC